MIAGPTTDSKSRPTDMVWTESRKTTLCLPALLVDDVHLVEPLAGREVVQHATVRRADFALRSTPEPQTRQVTFGLYHNNRADALLNHKRRVKATSTCLQPMSSQGAELAYRRLEIAKARDGARTAGVEPERTWQGTQRGMSSHMPPTPCHPLTTTLLLTLTHLVPSTMGVESRNCCVGQMSVGLKMVWGTRVRSQW